MPPTAEDPLPGGSDQPDPCPKKCKYCLQRLDVVESVPVEDYVSGKEPKSEREAVRDPTLAVMGLDDGDSEEKRQILLYNFSLYDGNGHLVPINDDLIFRRRDFKLHFNGVMKAIYSSDDDTGTTGDSGIVVEGAGPITEWWITGLGKDEIPMVGLSTELADYYLKNPSSAYSKIYSDLADKVKLTGVVYGILEEVMEKGTLNAFSYEDMLDELASKDQDINEETLLQYGAFIVQQINSYDEAGDNDEIRLTTAPFFRELQVAAGVSVRPTRQAKSAKQDKAAEGGQDSAVEISDDDDDDLIQKKRSHASQRRRNKNQKKRVKSGDSSGEEYHPEASKGVMRDLGKDGYKPETVTKATTTVLVRHVFESYFDSYLSRRAGGCGSTSAAVGLQMTGAVAQMCGVCKGCQQKDCGHCDSCEGMIKFGGKEDGLICDRRCCWKNTGQQQQLEQKLKSASASSIVEKQRRKTKMGESKVKWLLPLMNQDNNKKPNMKYYSQVKINGKVVNVGDCVLVRPDDVRTPLFVFKIVSLFQDNSIQTDGTNHSQNKLAHVQKFCRGSDTVLGETADPQELFALNECENIQLLEVEDKAFVCHWPGPATDFRLLGNTERSKVTPSKYLAPNQYWYRFQYNSTCARFETVHPDWISSKNGFCSCCQTELINKEFETPVLEKTSNESYCLHFRGEVFSVGDGIYLEPGTFENVQKWNTAIANNGRGQQMIDKNVDTTLHTEYYRKMIKTNESVKGDISTFPQPYEIGVITKIRPSKKDPRSPRVSVHVFYRPENIKNLDSLTQLSVLKSDSIHDFLPINYLFVSASEEEYVEVNKIEGKCEVRHCCLDPSFNRDNHAASIFNWSKESAHRFLYCHNYDQRAAIMTSSPDLFPKGHASPPAAKNEDVRPLRMMDVFAGVGGLSIGLEQAGVAEAKWAIEYVKDAANAFKANHPKCKVMLEDCNTVLRHALKGSSHMRKVRIPRKGEVEMLCGGPPCQGFSTMNRFTEGEYSMLKNSQISAYLSFCDYYRPRFFILENVKNFGSFNDSIVLKLCLRVLVHMGYQCTFGVLQAGNYGVPQTRRRIFLLAAAPDEMLPKYPEPMYVFDASDNTVRIDKKSFRNNIENIRHAPLRCVTIKDALYDLKPVKNGHAKEWIKYRSTPRSTYQQLMRYKGGEQGKEAFAQDCNDHVCKDMGALQEARFQQIPKKPGADWRDLPNKKVLLSNGQYAERLWYYYRDARDIRLRFGNDAVCECSTKNSKGKKKRCNPMDEQKQTLIPWFLPHTAHRNNQWAGLYGRIDWHGYFSTTVTDPSPGGKQGRVLHPEDDRVVSVRECARSQGFRDNFLFCGNIRSKHRQIGNAVPPPMAEALGNEIYKCLEAKVNAEADLKAMKGREETVSKTSEEPMETGTMPNLTPRSAIQIKIEKHM